jgi:hypothetical protein
VAPDQLAFALDHLSQPTYGIDIGGNNLDRSPAGRFECLADSIGRRLEYGLGRDFSEVMDCHRRRIVGEAGLVPPCCEVSGRAHVALAAQAGEGQQSCLGRDAAELGRDEVEDLVVRLIYFCAVLVANRGGPTGIREPNRVDPGAGRLRRYCQPRERPSATSRDCGSRIRGQSRLPFG